MWLSIRREVLRGAKSLPGPYPYRRGLVHARRQLGWNCRSVYMQFYLCVCCVISPYEIKFFVCIVFSHLASSTSFLGRLMSHAQSKRFSIINPPPPSRLLNNLISSINEPLCAVMCHKSEADTKTANKAIDAAYDCCLRPPVVYGTHISPYEVYRIDNQPSGAQQTLSKVHKSPPPKP